MSLQQNNMPMAGMNQPPQPPSVQRQGFSQGPEGPADIETVRRNYREALYELTFNSKPIITNLTIQAQENQYAAAAIVREIEQQIRHNAPGQKLPVLYLIDSICKNVGGVYIEHFGRDIASTFLDAYTVTDPNTRKSFERLLHTWKNGMPNGAPVFSRQIIESIERPLNYIRSRNQGGASPQRQPQQQQHISSSPTQLPHPTPQQQSRFPSSPQQQRTSSPRSHHQQIHVNPNFVQKRDPRDPRSRNVYSNQERVSRPMAPPVSNPVIAPTIPTTTTTQSSSLSGGGVPNDILSTLQSILPSSSQAIHNNNSTDKDAATSQLLSQIQSILPTLPPQQSSAIQQYLNQILGSSNNNNNNTSTPPLSQQQNQMTNLATPSPPVTAPINTAELLKGLTSMGILTGLGAGEPSEKHISLNDFGAFKLESKDLQIVRPGAIELLYSGSPLQCKQCGFRYPKTSEGQSKMDAHLDSHFRQNRRMKERVKRGLSRSWFVTEDEWVSGSGGELTSHQAPTFLLNDTSIADVTMGSPSASGGATTETVSPETHMVVMPNDEDRKPCPICGERFIDFWNDDEEEWMYKNAVMVDNTIYHATCHADAVKSGALVGSNEEEDTEMAESSQGVKRKIDYEDEIMDREDVKTARMDDDDEQEDQK
ncbi:hypothetical protein BDA99DRAFT_484022 [Phascolomyces articulosus]|uniref:CID domain-containing protein n=1 Tax=Phascolomyces articulosus TaxID=60185 RepID=A0AAD5PCU6_9FUNG|nr:hypothetical protein BDA99DRAFT_484022 [Phascolomyces articulosus]